MLSNQEGRDKECRHSPDVIRSEPELRISTHPKVGRTRIF